MLRLRAVASPAAPASSMSSVANTMSGRFMPALCTMRAGCKPGGSGTGPKCGKTGTQVRDHAAGAVAYTGGDADTGAAAIAEAAQESLPLLAFVEAGFAEQIFLQGREITQTAVSDIDLGRNIGASQ